MLLLGPALLALLCVGLPRRIFASGSPNAPVLNAFLLWILFLTLTDGTVDANLLPIAAGLFALAGLECVGRWLRPRQRQNVR